ncbi:hypothetical protein [Streptomyces sp. NPDC002540]
MRAAIPSLERLADVLGLVRSRRIISRSGHIGAYSYTVHGAGCRYEVPRRRRHMRLQASSSRP